jgi:hypothetical protein
VYELYLAARAPLFHSKIQSDERECDGDRLGALVGLLRRKCIDDVLVNECGITVRQRVSAQFIICVSR